MTNFAKPQNRRALLGTAILAAGLLTGSLMPQSASAQLSYCRSDPTIFLSNGMKLQLTASISANPATVRQITYVAYVPLGTTVTGLIYTGGALKDKENLTTVPINTAGNYDTVSTVYTGGHGIGVQTTTSALNTVTDGNPVSGTVTGQSWQPLNVHLNA